MLFSDIMIKRRLSNQSQKIIYPPCEGDAEIKALNGLVFLCYKILQG